MRSIFGLIFVFMGGLLLSACASSGASVGASRVSFATEKNEVWNRPLEVGFDMEDRHIKGVEKQLEILPVFNPFFKILNMLGVDTVDDMTSVAAYNAITENGADGLYVMGTKEDKHGFWPFYQHRTVSVYGKALKLKKVGQVDMKRADKASARICPGARCD